MCNKFKSIAFITIIFISVLGYGQETMNLSGEWQVKLDPQNKGMEEQWFTKKTFSDVLTLPGCIQEQGYGNIPGPKTIWWDVLTYAHPMVLDSYDSEVAWPKDYQSPIQPIDSWKINRKLALLTEAKVGNGKLVICSIDLEKDLDNRPATQLLRNNLLKYMSSDSFNPTNEVSKEAVQEIFNIKSK